MSASDLSDYFNAKIDHEDVSDWIDLTQDMVNQFADVTGDHQWIHVDQDRAKAESMFGGTIAHGYLVLSLVTRFFDPVPTDIKISSGINYGVENLRFPAPARVGAKLRGRRRLKTVTRLPGGGVKLVTAVAIEADDQKKPCCVFDSVVLYFP